MLAGDIEEFVDMLFVMFNVPFETFIVPSLEHFDFTTYAFTGP